MNRLHAKRPDTISACRDEWKFPSFMPSMFPIALALSLTGSGCEPSSQGTGVPDPACSSEGCTQEAVVITVSDDYNQGALATIDPASFKVRDLISAQSGDPIVRVLDNEAYVLNRSNTNSVRIYPRDSLSTPRLEFSVGENSNPHDAALCGDLLYVSLYEKNYLPAYDPETGLERARISLSAWDDGDGSPEASSLVNLGTHLFVGLEQMLRYEGWSSTAGTILEIDCTTQEIVNAWQAGPAVQIFPFPNQDDTLLLRTGVYFDDNYEVLLDGRLSLFDTKTGEITETFTTEEDLGSNLVAAAFNAAGDGIVATADADWYYSIYCLTHGHALRWAFTTPSAVFDAEANGDGKIWLAMRPGWADDDADGAIHIMDPGTCTLVTSETGIDLELPPYDIAFFAPEGT